MLKPIPFLSHDTKHLPSFEEGCTQICTSKKVYTNTFLIHENKILLGMKKRGFGIGKWNGFGGKVDVGETIIEAANREMKEEAGIDLTDIKKVGELEFVFSGRNVALIAHIFMASQFNGKVIETEEMKPQWFPAIIDAVPFEQMWSDDHLWFPSLLSGHPFKGAFYFDGTNESTLLAGSLYQVKDDYFL